MDVQEQPQTCEDREYRCCETLTDWEHYERFGYPQSGRVLSAECRHCGRRIIFVAGSWIDPEATGDDSVWSETCDSHDTFTAEHEPKEER